MKSLKSFSLAAMLAVAVTMFSSCLGEDESDAIIGPYLVTVDEYLGSKILKPDYFPDYTFIPSNPNTLGSFKRAFLYFKIANDVDMRNGGRYDVEIFTGTGIKVKDMLDIPVAGSAADTLKNDPVSNFALLSVYDSYVTTSANLNSVSGYYADMVKEKIANDTLYLQLNLNLKEGSTTADIYDSFVMPDAHELRQGGIVPQNDSIVVAVSAKVKTNNKDEKKTNYLKYKLY